MFTATFSFEKPTKNKVRFRNDDFGTVYVPNEVYQQLGQPERVTLTVAAAAVPQLAAAA